MRARFGLGFGAMGGWLRRRVAGLTLAGVVLGAGGSLPGQAAAGPGQGPAAGGKAEAAGSPATTIAVNARLVTVPAVVRDKKGAIVGTLGKDDFALSVDGKPQTIRYFDRDANLPLTLGLLVDTSGSVASALDEERSASSAFLDGMLASDKDRAFVMQFAHGSELLQDLTNSKPKLEAALRELATIPPDSGNGGGGDPDDSGGGARRRRGGGTTLYDAVFLAGDEIMHKQTGRKALVLLTDGEDRGSKESLGSAIEAVQRGDTVVYAIYFKGERPNGFGDRGGNPGGGGRRGGGIGFPGGGYPGGGRGYPGGGGGRGGGGRQGGGEVHEDGKKVLERITGETGGRVFEESKKQDFAAIYKQIAEELRSQYRLGFTPDATAAAEGYHQIDLAVPKEKNLRVQTRDGYYSGGTQGQ